MAYCAKFGSSTSDNVSTWLPNVHPYMAGTRQKPLSS